MATKFQFARRTVRLPGAYSQIVSGRNNPPLDLDYGRLLIIANAVEQIRGGAGINGEFSSGKDSIYEFNSLNDLQSFIGQGEWYKAVEAMFKPNRFDPGVSKVFVVKPFTTTSSTLSLVLETGSNGGTLALKTIDEGLLTKGILEEIDTVDYLTKGYAYTVEAGERDPSKYILKFWLATYTGEHTDTYAFNEITKPNARPQLIAKSVEFDNMQTLIDWANTDKSLAGYFSVLSTSVIKGTGAVDPTEIALLDGYQVALAGTEEAVSGDFTDMLEAISDLNYNAVMYVSGDDVEVDSNTIMLLSHLDTEAKFDKFLVVGGSNDTLSDSIATAAAFNSDKVICVHGGIKKRSQVSPTGFRIWDSFYHAAYIAGRLLGLPPQVPITFKAIDVDGVVSNLKERDCEDALDAGVLVTNLDTDRGLFVVEQGINTLQDNDYTLNPDATSHVIQIKRIAAQLNKEIIINAKRQLLSQPAGVNRNTLSENDVSEWLDSYLARKVATTTLDNLIISYEDITVTRVEDAYFITYKFNPNSEINKLFFTGFML